jgi:DNA replication initiation complex subunit (GINS family)
LEDAIPVPTVQNLLYKTRIHKIVEEKQEASAMTAKERTLWEQAVRVLRRNTITVEHSGAKQQYLRRAVSGLPRGGGGPEKA